MFKIEYSGTIFCLRTAKTETSVVFLEPHEVEVYLISSDDRFLITHQNFIEFVIPVLRTYDNVVLVNSDGALTSEALADCRLKLFSVRVIGIEDGEPTLEKLVERIALSVASDIQSSHWYRSTRDAFDLGVSIKYGRIKVTQEKQL